MILQALYEYYQRKAQDPDSNIAPQGLEWKEIPFLIVIDKEGNFIKLEETNEGSGKEKRSKRFLVNKSVGRSGANSWQIVNVFWDHLGMFWHTQKMNHQNLLMPRRNSNHHLLMTSTIGAVNSLRMDNLPLCRNFTNKIIILLKYWLILFGANA